MSTTDFVAALGLLFAAIAAGCAAWAIREARASGREQHRATQQLKATVTTLGEVLTQATQLVELEGQALRELRGLTREQHQAAEELRLHRQVDRLTVVGERVEELGQAVETAKLQHLLGQDTSHAVSAARARLTIAVVSTGGDPALPHCALLTHGHAADDVRNGVNVTSARGEVEGAIVNTRAALRSVLRPPSALVESADAIGTEGS